MRWNPEFRKINLGQNLFLWNPLIHHSHQRTWLIFWREKTEQFRTNDRRTIQTIWCSLYMLSAPRTSWADEANYFLICFALNDLGFTLLRKEPLRILFGDDFERAAENISFRQIVPFVRLKLEKTQIRRNLVVRCWGKNAHIFSLVLVDFWLSSVLLPRFFLFWRTSFCKALNFVLSLQAICSRLSSVRFESGNQIRNKTAYGSKPGLVALSQDNLARFIHYACPVLPDLNLLETLVPFNATWSLWLF